MRQANGGRRTEPRAGSAAVEPAADAGRGARPRPGAWTRRAAVRLGGTVGASLGVTLRATAGLGGSRPRAVVPPTPRAPAGRPAGLVSRLDPIVVIDSTDVRALALRALDAAKAAGAEYADVRLTRQLTQQLTATTLAVAEDETVGVGVRVRIGGAWGFAASPYWEPDEMVALAHEAVAEAKLGAALAARPAEWAPIPVARGHWTPPITVDPFVVPIEEKMDFFRTWELLPARYRKTYGRMSDVAFWREERAVATSEGSYFTQTLYRSGTVTGGGFVLHRHAVMRQEEDGLAEASPSFATTVAGWELFTEADIPGQIPGLYGAAVPPTTRAPREKPGDIGRYDVVFTAGAMGALLERTLGVATQLDRVLGHEANAGGTSYLGPDPLALLGSYQAASPLVTVTANRSMPRGFATVKWDDEGVEPEDFTLIKDGLLMDYQTTRELAPVLAAYYQQHGRPVRSHGCAAAQDATYLTLPHSPNLVLEPSPDAGVDFGDLVADTKRGIAVIGGPVNMDFQARTGAISGLKGKGLFYEIVNGQLGAQLTELECLFSSPTLWKNVVALGSATSAVQYASGASKGQPAQAVQYSVRAVPGKVKDVDFINALRKA